MCYLFLLNNEARMASRKDNTAVPLLDFGIAVPLDSIFLFTNYIKPYITRPNSFH